MRQIIAVFVVLPLLGLIATPVMAALGVPYLPASDEQVLETLPSTLDPRVRAFAPLQQDLRARPDSPETAERLSRAYLEYGRSSGDARYLGRAMAVIAPWLARPAPPVAIVVIQAMILQSRHQFDASRDVLDRLLQIDPGNAQALLILASVDQVQGRLDLARRDCARLLGRVDALTVAACIGGVQLVSGQAQAGYTLIDGLLQQQTDVPPAEQAWAQGLLAEAAGRLGRPRLADTHYRAALQLEPGDNFLLAEYADFLLDQQRPQDVIALVGDYRQSDTSFLRLVIAEVQLGLPQAAADTQQMASRFSDLADRGDGTLYAREEAMFELRVRGDAAKALAIAQRNWQLQRAPADVRILLESALATGDRASAQPVLDFVTKTQLDDPVIRSLQRRLNALKQGTSTSVKMP